MGEESAGLQDLTILPSGGAGEDVGIYSTIGPVEYAGCSAEAGAEGEDGCASGCEGGGGCATGGRMTGRSLLLFFVFVLGVLRRRGE